MLATNTNPTLARKEKKREILVLLVAALRKAEGTAGDAAGLPSRQRETREEAALLVAAAAMIARGCAGISCARSINSPSASASRVVRAKRLTFMDIPPVLADGVRAPAVWGERE